MLKVEDKKFSWGTEFPFGKYKGKTLAAVTTADKAYIAWALQENLHEKYPELKWVLDNIKPYELNEILKLQKFKK